MIKIIAMFVFVLFGLGLLLGLMFFFLGTKADKRKFNNIGLNSFKELKNISDYNSFRERLLSNINSVNNTKSNIITVVYSIIVLNIYLFIFYITLFGFVLGSFSYKFVFNLIKR